MEWRLDDPSGKIAKSIDGDVVTLTIDASQYAAGSYTAELLAMNGTKTAKRTIAYTVSKGDNPTGISMDFYPNPCTDVLNILPNYSGESTIRIRNSMGTEVMNITLGLINEEPVKLDVSGLASGTLSGTSNLQRHSNYPHHSQTLKTDVTNYEKDLHSRNNLSCLGTSGGIGSGVPDDQPRCPHSGVWPTLR
ncbi:MAG: T9SS type A sorting domain-containing protein [Alistipes putredinis]